VNSTFKTYAYALSGVTSIIDTFTKTIIISLLLFLVRCKTSVISEKPCSPQGLSIERSLVSKLFIVGLVVFFFEGSRIGSIVSDILHLFDFLECPSRHTVLYLYFYPIGAYTCQK
jgi:hypothetical protein